MNGQPLFRFQFSERDHTQNPEIQRPSQEHVKSKVLDLQAQNADNKLMSSKRYLTAQTQQHEKEHMATLSAKLHQEADKIRKWKIQTEFDLKDKVKKLSEASLQIDVMKKSLLELQLENERTSGRLQEEIENREDTLRRIHVTREMCSLLQAHASKMDDRLTKCETERTELKYVGKENMQLIEELTKQFCNLQMTATESKKRIQSQTNVERSDRMQVEKAMKSKIDTVEQELQKLKNTLKEKDGQFYEQLVTLQEKDNKIQAMKNSIDELQKKISSMHEEFVIKEEEIKESSLRISAIQDEKFRLEKMLKGLQQEFNSLQIAKDNIVLDMSEDINKLQKQLQHVLQDTESANKLLGEEQLRFKTCSNKLAETSAEVETLKKMRDSLMMEKIDLEMILDSQKYQISNLLTEKSEDKDEIHRISGEIVMLTRRLDKENLCRMQVQDEMDTLQIRISTLMLERDDHVGEIVNLKNQLTVNEEKINSLESLLSEEEHKTIKLQNDLNKMEQRTARDREDLQELEEQLGEMKQELCEKNDIALIRCQEIEKLKRDLQALNVCNEEKQNELNASKTGLECLRSQIAEKEDIIKDLKSQLNDIDERKNDIDKSFLQQKKTAASTLKQNKDLEKEVKNMKAALEKEIKNVKKRDDTLFSLQEEMKDLQKLKDDCEKSHQQYEQDMDKLKEQCKLEQEAARLAMKKAKEMQESAEKEKQNAEALTGYRLAEMMETLETYKQNNENLILVKDVEIQTLKSKLESAESLSLQREKDFEKEIEHLKSQMISSSKQTPGKTQKLPTIGSTTSKKLSQEALVLVTPMKTPQRSKIRSGNLSTVSKRRRVAFLSKDSSHLSSSEESDLMEFKMDYGHNNKKGTPLLYKASPKHKNNGSTFLAPINITPRRTPMCTPCKIPMNRLSAEYNDRKMVTIASDESNATSAKPEKTTEAQTSNKESRTQVVSDNKTSNIRNAPAKKMSKIFTVSPRNKLLNAQTKIKEKTKQSQMSWFDHDSVFGFGPED